MKQFAALLFLLLCSCQMLTDSSEDRVLAAAFDCLKQGSWEGYSKLIITPSDFDLRSQGLISPWKSNMSYSSILKKEEIERHRVLFMKAAKSGERRIDFGESTFLSAGKTLHSGQQELPSGDFIEVKEVPFRIRDRAGEIHEELSPTLVLVTWGSELRIIGINLD